MLDAAFADSLDTLSMPLFTCHGAPRDALRLPCAVDAR